MRSLCGQLAQETISNDVEKTILAFDEIRSADPGLVVRVNKDGVSFLVSWKQPAKL